MSIPPWNSIHFCYMSFDYVVRYICGIFLINWPLCSYVDLISSDILSSEIYFFLGLIQLYSIFLISAKTIFPNPFYFNMLEYSYLNKQTNKQIKLLLRSIWLGLDFTQCDNIFLFLGLCRLFKCYVIGIWLNYNLSVYYLLLFVHLSLVPLFQFVCLLLD